MRHPVLPAWEADGKTIHWSLGNAHFVYDVDKAKAFDDSLRIAKRDEEKRKADSLAKAKADTTQKIKADSTKVLKDTAKKAKMDSAIVNHVEH